MSSILIGGIVKSLLIMESWWKIYINRFEFERLTVSDFIIFESAVRMAERSNALR